MFELYRGRTLDLGDTCKVYRNLNNKKFSIVAISGQYKGKVVAHTESIVLSDVQFKISEASRKRALRELTRNVHAFAIGKVESLTEQTHNPKMICVTYHPFELPYFYLMPSKSPISSTSKLYLHNGKAFCY